MMDSRDNEKLIKQSKKLAWEAVQQLNLPNAVELNSPHVFGRVFGHYMRNKITTNFDTLLDKYGENLPALIALAIREYWFSCHAASCYIRLCIDSGDIPDSPVTRDLSSAERYAVYEGHAYTLYNSLAEIHRSLWRLAGTPFTTFPDTNDLLDAISLYWLDIAATHFAAGNIEGCFTFLHEAYDAASIGAGNRMFDYGVESSKHERSSMAKRAAQEKLKRDPRQKDKGFVRNCWQDWQNNPERYPSKAAFARDMLDKCVHLVSSKKIEDWCREWESGKKILPQLAK